MRRLAALLISSVPVVMFVSSLLGQAPPAGKKLPPQNFDKSLVDKFFPDLRQAVGPGQPGGQTIAASGGGASPTAPMTATPATGGGEGASSGWQAIISGETLENEIKVGTLAVADSVSSIGKFNTGHRETRKIYSVLAACFAVIAEYNGDVRFKDKAAGMRELIGRSGFNCKVATTGAHNEARLRFEDLQALTRGGTIDLPNAETSGVSWNDKVANRPPLMQRMEDALDRALKPFSSSKAEFEANKEKLLHEAEILAMLARAIQHESYEYADDDSYLEHAKAIEKDCNEIVNGLKINSLEQVQAAVGGIGKACSNCHEFFRG